MENDRDAIMSILHLQGQDRAQSQVFEEAVLQLVQQLIAPNHAAASAFEAGMRTRMNEVLEEAESSLDQHRAMTAALAALLQSAGRPPSRG